MEKERPKRERSRCSAQAIQVRKVHQHRVSQEASPERDDPICELHHPKRCRAVGDCAENVDPQRDTGENMDTEN